MIEATRMHVVSVFYALAIALFATTFAIGGALAQAGPPGAGTFAPRPAEVSRPETSRPETSRLPETSRPLESPRPVESPAIASAVALVADRGTNALIVDLSREAPVIVRPLAQPDRLVIELQGVVFVAGAPAPVKAGGLVRAYRYGLVLGERSRIVLDLAEPAIVQHIDFVPIEGVMRLVLQLRKVDRAAFAEAVARMQVAEAAGTEDGARLPPVKADSRPLVLIDPGHGGIDPGAIGTTGVAEKDIVLSVAHKIRDRALGDGRVQVVLTREDDVFLPLGERVRIGRKLQPAFMLSLHADKIAAEPRLRGASIYTLSEKASDAAAARAAENENKADLQAGGQVPETQPEGIGDILYDLARRESRHASVGMARHIIGAMGEATPVLGRPLRAAGFRVLTAPDVPAALLELGYLSNPEDVKQLTTPEWQEAIAQRIVAALVERLAGRAGDRTSTGAIRPAP